MMTSKIKKTIVSTLLLGFSLNTLAATVDLAVSDSGWYTNAGFHSAVIKNYYATEQSGQRNYFTFDLSGVDASNVSAATFKLYTYTIQGAGTFSLFDVSTPSNVLSQLSVAGPDGVAINADLGTGKSYGSYTISSTESNSFINIALNSDFLADLKSATGTISIGGIFTPTTSGTSYAFGLSAPNSGNVLSLEVTPVPEPSSALLFGAGLAVASLARRYKSK